MNTETTVCGVIRGGWAYCPKCAGRVLPTDHTVRPSEAPRFKRHGLACVKCGGELLPSG